MRDQQIFSPFVRAFSVAGLFVVASCTTVDLDEDATSYAEQAVSPCTSIALVTPVNLQVGQVGVPMTLAAAATCPGDHEFQYWAKPTSQSKWIILHTNFVPDSFDWSPPSEGPWHVTAVARSVGNPGYDVRANSRLVNIEAAPPANNPPVANTDDVQTPHDVALQFDPRANDTDADNDPLTIANATSGNNGTVTFTSTDVTYTPSAGFVGTDSFQYTISDGNGGTATGTVNVTVTNGVPTAVDDAAATHPNQSVSGNVLGNDTDPENDTLTVTGNTNPTSGTVTVAPNGDFTYTAGATTGTDTFQYTISDGHGGTATATVTINITNGDPSANDDVFSVNQDTLLNGNLLTNDTDPENDPLMVTSHTDPSNGSVTVAANGDFTYTPDTGFTGTDGFTYTITDGFGGMATGNVSIAVTAVTPGCTISLSAPASGVFGQQFTVTATATCNTGAPEIRWFRKIGNGATQQVQGFGSSLTFDYTPTALGNHTFTAEVRTQGTTSPTTLSNPVVVNVADDVPQCTSVKLIAPAPASTHSAGGMVTMTGQATCPEGTVVEYQYWFKSASTGVWTVIPGYTTGSGTWEVPMAPGPYDLTVVARAVGAHVAYQVRANSVRVSVQ